MIEVTLVCSPAPRTMFEQRLELVDGSTLRDAVVASELAMKFPSLDWQGMAPGIWGKAADWSRLVAHLDRIELCRELTVDPKVARRERFRRQGAGATGLFARRRAGGKAGY